jgi:hypothetical protein
MKITNGLSQDNRFPRQDLNLGPPENEVGVLTTWPQRSVDQTGILCRMIRCSLFVFEKEWGRIELYPHFTSSGSFHKLF